MSNELPKINIKNLFELDRFGQTLWIYHLGSEKFQTYKEQYQKMGVNGAIATELSQTADVNGPKHIPFDRSGERIDSISYHPSYHKLKELSYGVGIIAQKYTGPLFTTDKAIRHFVGFSTGYYFAQTETGLYCPICMTDALGRVLEMHAQDIPEAAEVLKRFKSQDVSELWEGAMFLTERQGGSDVGANEVQARYEDGKWKLSGLKWFCSNADADAILALARIKDPQTGQIESGTKGLGLFLLTRQNPKDNSKSWEILRLKDKLGVRSMASAEIELKDSVGTLIGGVGQGFKMMTDMVNMSRVYNSVAALAIARRSILEAYLFAQERKAFGQTLDRLPLYKRSLAELQSEFLGLHFLIFECIKQMDMFDQGSQVAGKTLRTLTPLCKATSGKFSVFAAAEAMELVGGNAYIEEHILPRLYRDAQVLPIWEGTTQIQSLDLLRVLGKEGIESFVTRITEAIKSPTDKAIKNILEQRLKEILVEIQKTSQSAIEEQQRASRWALEKLGRIAGQALMYEASALPELKTTLLSALRISLGRTYLSDPLGTSIMSQQQDEEVVLTSIM
ncbi:MAG: acyl-CoA dehydrogenase family protein [Bdellovibrionaceae bacterium]|nr:acyl-CoA dehydrogenase family protein [Pseudobdellovibrionaceae bacterium]